MTEHGTPASASTAAGRARVLAEPIGLNPLETILARHGADRAKLFGWSEPFEDASHLAARREQCESMTDQICGVALDASLDAAEQEELVGLSGELVAQMT